MRTSASRLHRFLRILSNNRIFLALGLLVLVPTIGTAGYMLIEGWGLFDALYMTIITMATIGYGETHPLGTTGRVFTLGVIVVGVTIAAYSFTVIAEAVLRPERLAQRFLQRRLNIMENHYVVCGCGKSGSRIAKELWRINKLFVVVEEDAEKTEWLRAAGIPVITGDATTEETLKAAGIERAIGLVTTLHTDAANVFAVLTARDLNPNLHIVARADQNSAEAKLRRAGADAVLSPYEIGAIRMTHQLLRQNIIDSFELVTDKISLDISFQEIIVSEHPEFIGRTLPEINLRQAFNIIVIAIKKPDGNVEFPPSLTTRLEGGATLIVAAASEDILRLHRIA